LGGLAVAYGLQMWPALIAVCWWPWLTRQGVISGLIAGLVAVTLTETLGAKMGTPWGRWPLTIHSAGWGIFLNLSVAVTVSALTQKGAETRHRLNFHQFLKDQAGLPQKKKALVPWAWAFVITWFLFGVGPGAVIGNTVFGDPGDSGSWLFGIPSIWAWQLLWWGIGVVMMWFLAYKMELSTPPEQEIVSIQDDIGDTKQEETIRR
ncbi:MAG TPA: sodium:solute symporter family protein, partial [Nitrospiria bacterium]